MRGCGLSSSVLQAVPDRAALAVWICKLDLCDLGEGDSPDVPSAYEGMLDWIVLSVKSG